MDVILYTMEAEASDHALREIVPLTLKFYKSDPLAVSLVFQQCGDEIPWQVSRELLSDGLNGEAGSGDISFWPLAGGELMAIWLDGTAGSSAYLTVNRDKVREFLNQTEELVPIGDGEEERLILAELNEWLESMN